MQLSDLTTEINGTLGHLKMMAQMQKMCGQGYSSAQLIIDNGLTGRVMPTSFKLRHGRKKECFKNALEVAILHGHVYCEGVANGSVIPVDHAWCIDLDGNVIDPTWDCGTDYIGVPFTTEYVMRFTEETMVYDSVILDWRRKFPLITSHDALVAALHPSIEDIRRKLSSS